MCKGVGCEHQLTKDELLNPPHMKEGDDAAHGMSGPILHLCALINCPQPHLDLGKIYTSFGGFNYRIISKLTALR